MTPLAPQTDTAYQAGEADASGGTMRGFTDGTEARRRFTRTAESIVNVHTAIRVQHASVPSQGGVCPAHRTSMEDV